MLNCINFKLSSGKFLFSLCCFILCFNSLGQKRVNFELQAKGDVSLTSTISIPKINNGYTVWLPDSGVVNGLVVFFHSRRDTTSDSIINYATSKQLAVLYATTDNRVEFFFQNEKMLEIEEYIHKVIETYNIPDSNTLYCGMSLEGTRALKLAKFSKSENSKFHLSPKAIAICDAPLDMVRFHKAMIRAKELKYTPITANEGNWVSGCLESNLGGTPTDTLVAYINYSPYSYSTIGNEYLSVFKSISIRAYTEPDVNWWIDTRRKDYYSMNSLDLAGLVNELKILGNNSAELIITHDKGYYDDGSRHPHNWNIVDEKELIDWFLRTLAKNK
jgi:hypothetical protein